MNVTVQAGRIEQATADTIIVNLFQGVTRPGGATGAVDKALNGAITDLIAGQDFKGDVGEVAVLYPRGAVPARRVLIAGLGESAKFDLEGVRRAAAGAIRRARDLHAETVATIVQGAGIAGLQVDQAAQATVEGSLLALYRYQAEGQAGKSEHEISQLAIVEFDAAKVEAIERAIVTAEALAEAVRTVRDLVNMPPNVATPTRMAETAQAIAADYDLRVTVGDRGWASKRQMGAYLAVAKGAGEEPTFIILEHMAERTDLPTVALVGKGITFDTGGISLKSRDQMGRMKNDMAGAAVVLGVMQAAGALALPVRLIGIAPCTENMPDAHAYRPADVIRASNGKTIEIVSTDAEGRMVLADALVHAASYQPDAVIDLATLTGSCITALGMNVAAGLFSNDDALEQRLRQAGEITHERVWSLPLWDDYRETIRSEVADMKNSGGRFGGVGTSAVFLREFVSYPWAHLDIAGMAASDKATAYSPAGATGFGVRLLVEALRSW